MEKLLQLQGITKTYDKTNTVLRGVDLAVEAGEYISIMGRSGSGKTTLMNILGMLDLPTEGEYRFRETRIAGHASRDRLRGDEISFIFQAYHLIEHYSVMDNILMPFLYSATALSKEKIAEITALAEELNMVELLNKRVALLSGGEKQRVAILRAMAKRPSLILADEPTGNLDGVNAKIIHEKLKQVTRQGSAVIVVTHSEDVFRDVDTAYRLENGVLI